MYYLELLWRFLFYFDLLSSCSTVINNDKAGNSADKCPYSNEITWLYYYLVILSLLLPGC